MQAEASEAKNQDKYLPVKFNPCEVPLNFTQRTSQSLMDWEVGDEHTGFAQLLKDSERLVKRPLKPITIGLNPWWKLISPIWLISSPPLLGGVIAGSLMLWPGVCPRGLDHRAGEFTIGKMPLGKTTINGFDVQAIAVEKFLTFAFEPERLEVADPSQYQIDRDEFSSSAWKSLNVDGSRVTSRAKDQMLHPRVVVEGLNDLGQAIVQLDSMVVAQGTRMVHLV